MTVVALTSIPPRFDTLPARLAAILAQTPARLCLTIPHRYRRFPDWDGTLPALPRGVDLIRADDHGPATKFLTVFKRFPDADILIGDDDCRYLPGWLAAFQSARIGNPDAVIAASTFDSARLGLPPGHAIVQGFAGVLLKPADLTPDGPDPDDPALWVDDIWLSAQIARAGLPILPCPAARVRVTPHPAPAALQHAVIDGNDRATLNRTAALTLGARLGIWRDKKGAAV